jgi:hypothetical protein
MQVMQSLIIVSKYTFQDTRVIRSTLMEVTFYSDRDVKAGVWNDEARRNPSVN